MADEQKGLGVANNRHPDSTYAAKYPFNWVEKYEWGEIHHDATPGNARIRVGHSSGSHMEMSADGKTVTMHTGHSSEYTKGGTTVTVDQNSDTKQSGHVRVSTSGDAHVEAKGDMSTVVHGNMTSHIGGDSISSSGGDTVQASKGGLIQTSGKGSSHKMDGDQQWSIKGNYTLQVGGNVLINAGGSITTQSGSSTTIVAGSTLNTQSGDDTNQKMGAKWEVHTGDDIDLIGGGTSTLKGKDKTIIQGVKNALPPTIFG